MLDIKRIRDQYDAVVVGLAARGVKPDGVSAIRDIDLERRQMVTEVESLKGVRNRVSKEIGLRRKRGDDTAEAEASMRQVGDQIGALDERIRKADERLQAMLLMIPNIPHPGLPKGLDASGNQVVRTWGTVPTFNFMPRSHVELAEKLGVVDFARGTKISGAGFPLYVGLGARLQRALIQFMLDIHVRDHGYTELWPPVVVNAASMTGTGQLPKMKDDMYAIPEDDLYLIPTAEVPVTNYYRDEVISSPLPIYLTAYTPCFRREAGAAGRDTRGLIRVHQFDKVEMVKFTDPATSYEELESLVLNAEDILQRLQLPYRVLMLCSGDISFAAAKCYDIELWAPGQNAWLEVSSCSNFEDFQARRAGIRYRDAKGKINFVHTLNGSGVALARLVVALLENGQQADGSVLLPAVLAPYLGGVDRLPLPH
ncbi:MAG: serine--tRNA ligase [Lentisphaerae bacterium RIFOXYC12_FULL_60_16]|nr:MAG: serine--tRNA ligase [Lentisphaerae bacterium RIFOXYC12_FULL_60_16]OGV77301.1 MAG: serine--tRNA ligase [Lentisphaerae bacterium RIFOXYB12_FULL_60_10]